MVFHDSENADYGNYAVCQMQLSQNKQMSLTVSKTQLSLYVMSGLISLLKIKGDNRPDSHMHILDHTVLIAVDMKNDIRQFAQLTPRKTGKSDDGRALFSGKLSCLNYVR